jgi:hypothetical protein
MDKLKARYLELDKLHTIAVKDRDWARVAKVFAQMMTVSDAMYGKRGS